MPTQAEIQNTILSAELQMADLVEANRVKLLGGVQPRLIDWQPSNWYRLNINALQRQYDLSDYTSDGTLAVYDCLQKKIGFDITANSIDPNYQIPNTTVIIDTSSPPPLDIPWADFDPDTQDPDGGRTTYFNVNWAGFNPMLWLVSPAGTALFVGIDYSIVPTGGFVLLPGGNLPAIFDGQVIRATGFETA